MPPRIRELINSQSRAQESVAYPFPAGMPHGSRTGLTLTLSGPSAPLVPLVPLVPPHPILPFLLAADALGHVESLLGQPFELATTAGRVEHQVFITDSTMMRVRREGLRVQLRCQRVEIRTPMTCWPIQVHVNFNSLPVRLESVSECVASRKSQIARIVPNRTVHPHCFSPLDLVLSDSKLVPGRTQAHGGPAGRDRPHRQRSQHIGTHLRSGSIGTYAHDTVHGSLEEWLHPAVTRCSARGSRL